MPATRRASYVLAEERPRRRPRLLAPLILLGVLAGLVLAGYLGVRHLVDDLRPQSCTATALGRSTSFDPEQMANAATIVGIGAKRGLPARAATIAIATAIQESKLRNISYGDRDSVGLFQQRPSQGWGTREQLQDPEYATNAFYDALVKIDGYASMEITKVAQRVQRSAYPEAYADHEGQGRILASTISGHSPAALGCRLKPAAAGAGNPADLGADLTRELGLRGTAAGRTVTVRTATATQAWSVASWAVAKAGVRSVTRVDVAGRSWQRDEGPRWRSGGTGSDTSVRISLS